MSRNKNMHTGGRKPSDKYSSRADTIINGFVSAGDPGESLGLVDGCITRFTTQHIKEANEIMLRRTNKGKSKNNKYTPIIEYFPLGVPCSNTRPHESYGETFSSATAAAHARGFLFYCKSNGISILSNDVRTFIKYLLQGRRAMTCDEYAHIDAVGRNSYFTGVDNTRRNQNKPKTPAQKEEERKERIEKEKEEDKRRLDTIEQMSSEELEEDEDLQKERERLRKKLGIKDKVPATLDDDISWEDTVSSEDLEQYTSWEDTV